MSDIDAVMAYTDWALLAQQKEQILFLLSFKPVSDDLKPAHEALEGLLNWIDAIQDAAEHDGFPVVWLEDKE